MKRENLERSKAIESRLNEIDAEKARLDRWKNNMVVDLTIVPLFFNTKLNTFVIHLTKAEANNLLEVLMDRRVAEYKQLLKEMEEL